MYCPYFVRAKVSADYATHVSYNFFLKKERKKEKKKKERKKERMKGKEEKR